MRIIGIVCTIALFALLAKTYDYHTRRQSMNDKDIADLLQRRLDGAEGQSREWANFVDASFKKPRLEAIRKWRALRIRRRRSFHSPSRL
jgi:hypothetical protein